MRTGVPSAQTTSMQSAVAAELHVVHPPSLRARHALGRGGVILGRQPGERTFAILHEFVSRKHLALEWDAANATHTAVDLGSCNGSFIDGIAAKTPVALRDGSVLRLGPAVLVYELGAAADGDEPEAAGDSAIPGQAMATRRLRAAVARIAPRASPVLLTGETGSGKESVAREIHRLSGRSGKLITVDCAALGPELIERELEQPGLLREAHGGTLLLDEIGELPLPLQAKLLRALQERSVRPGDGTREFALDVRIVAATSRRELAQLVEWGDFRRDLRAGLAPSEIRVPSLKQRRADLTSWLELFCSRFSETLALPTALSLQLEPEVVEAVLRRAWPDNLRGLDRLVHALAESTGSAGGVALSDLPVWFWNEPGDLDADGGGLAEAGVSVRLRH